MVLINLLAWRLQYENYIKIKKRQTYVAAAVAAISLILILHISLQYYIDLLEGKIQVIHVQSEQILLREKVSSPLSIAKIDKNERDNIPQIIRTLTAKPLQNICFNAINQQHGHIKFMGEANTTDDVAELLTSWNVMQYVPQITVTDLKSDKNGQIIFQLDGLQSDENVQ